MLRTPFYALIVNGKELPDWVYDKITKVQFKEPEDGEETFTIYMKDNDFTIQDSDIFIEDKTVVSLFMGYSDNFGSMMDGLVSNIMPKYPKSEEPTLEIKVKNIANVMDRLEKSKKFVGKTYSDIIKEIAAIYNMICVVEDTTPIYKPDIRSVEGINQAGLSDWNFMQYLAEKINYDCYIQNGILFFLPSKSELEVSIGLEYRLGKCNLLDFSPNLSTTKSGQKMSMSNINILDKNIVGVDGANEAGSMKPEPVTPEPEPARTYVVKSGDYLIKIASAMYGDGSKWKQIADANGISGPKYIIYPNQKLIIP